MDIARLKILGRFTKDLATLSKCEDRQVAAIITDARGFQVYSIGINGGPKGGPDCMCNTGHKYSCIHAEANAIAKCMSPDPNKTIITTLSPCVTCASLIINSGFSAVYYLEEWKDTTGNILLLDAGITTKYIGGII